MVQKITDSQIGLEVPASAGEQSNKEILNKNPVLFEARRYEEQVQRIYSK